MYFLATYWLTFEMVHCGEIFKNHSFIHPQIQILINS
jgi:hypothetical protein